MAVGSRKRWLVLLCAAAGVFTALLLLQALFQGLSSPRQTVANSYERLAAALSTGGLLPLGSLGEVRAALRVLGLGELQEDSASAAAVNCSALAGAVRLYSNDTRVLWVEFSPQLWRNYPPGELLTELRAIAKVDYYTQAQAARRVQGLRVAPSDFDFTATAGTETYTITPVFDEQGACILVRFSRQRPNP